MVQTEWYYIPLSIYKSKSYFDENDEHNYKLSNSIVDRKRKRRRRKRSRK